MIDLNGETKSTEQMITQQIKNRGVSDPKVLEAFKKVDRASFVPQASKFLAYEDRPLPIGEGQTISQPYVVAVMMEALNLDDTHKVLEIGGGSLYNAALMAQIVNQVFTIEIKKRLFESALTLKEDLNLENIFIKQGDGHQGWPDKAPFDRIILTAAPPVEIPQNLIDQLSENGKMIAPLGEETQHLILYKKEKGQLKEEKNLFQVRFVPMVLEE